MKLLKTIVSTVLLSLVVGSAFASATLYGAPWCHNCTEAKEILQKNCIQYTYVNIDKNNPYGINAIPELRVNGQKLVGSGEIQSWAEAHNQCGK